jgi:L-threonylcarbamoyladenylate synthase
LIDTLAVDVPQWLRAMVAELWPGPLTVILPANPSIAWDLGDTAGTVALRVPDHEVTRQLIDRTGPLAVSSANISGSPAATNIDEALRMLGDSVEVYLDDGPTLSDVPSTILDVTAATAKVVRLGGVDLATLHAFNNTIIGPDASAPQSTQLAAQEQQGADD